MTQPCQFKGKKIVELGYDPKPWHLPEYDNGELTTDYEVMPVTDWKFVTWPKVPVPVLQYADFNSNERLRLPAAPGVYFFSVKTSPSIMVIDYIGQSVSLYHRVTKSHKKFRRYHHISYLLLPKEDLDYAESFYIGAYRPPQNFPKSSTWAGVANALSCFWGYDHNHE